MENIYLYLLFEEHRMKKILQREMINIWFVNCIFNVS